MATTPVNQVIQHLLAACGQEGMTDGELLTRFLNSRDDAALSTLVRRHGPMVWGVCCRLLRNHHDAEDAFQATFLVLVQKAATLPDRETVGNWLYGVAHQTAVRMRAVVAKRGVRERQVTVMPEPATAEQYVWNDLLPFLDEELSRLPDKYRALIVLCDLEGVTRKEVARQLDLPEGTAASRLAAARAMLAKRLARRGIAASGVLLGAVLSQQSAWAIVPTTVIPDTIKAATLVAAGHAAAGAVSPTVTALATGVTKAMFLTKVKTVLAAVLVVGLTLGGIGAGVGLSTNPAAVAQQPGAEHDDAKKSVPLPAGRATAPDADEVAKLKREIELLKKEIDLLRRENDLLKKEQAGRRPKDRMILIIDAKTEGVAEGATINQLEAPWARTGERSVEATKVTKVAGEDKPEAVKTWVNGKWVVKDCTITLADGKALAKRQILVAIDVGDRPLTGLIYLATVEAKSDAGAGKWYIYSAEY